MRTGGRCGSITLQLEDVTHAPEGHQLSARCGLLSCHLLTMGFGDRSRVSLHSTILDVRGASQAESPTGAGGRANATDPSRFEV